MASLDEIRRAGLEVSESGADEQIAGLVTGVATAIPAEVEKRAKREKEDAMEQVKLYAQLREAGYSSEDATAKVHRTYRSTSFIERLVRGKGNAFQPPTGPGKTDLETQKTKAEIAETKMNTRLKHSQSKYYERGGPGRTVIDRMTPNQLQSRLKFLTDELGRDMESDQVIQDEIDTINERLRALSMGEGGRAPGAAGEKVIMEGPDGKTYRIPKENVEKAKARGFKTSEKSI